MKQTAFYEDSANLRKAEKLLSMLPKEHLTDTNGTPTINLHEIKQASKHMKNILPSNTITAFNQYLNGRTLRSLSDLIQENPEILCFNITPYELYEKETIQEIHGLIKDITSSSVSESYFYNTILHSEIANSTGDDKDRFYRGSDQMYSGKVKATYILRFLEKIKEGKPDLVKDVIESEDVDGKTPLLLACMTRNYELASGLLDLGSNPNVSLKNVRDLSPLHIAYIMGNVELISKLEEKGADKNKKDSLGRTPSEYIKPSLEKERVKLIDTIFNDEVNLFHGVHYKAQDRTVLPEYKRIEEKLHDAIRGANKEEVKKLLPFSDINYQDSLGRTAMHFACMRPSLVDKTGEKDKNTRVEILNILLDKDPDLSLKNKNGNTVGSLIERDKTSDSFKDKEFAKSCDKSLQSKNSSVFLGKY